MARLHRKIKDVHASATAIARILGRMKVASSEEAFNLLNDLNKMDERLLRMKKKFTLRQRAEINRARANLALQNRRRVQVSVGENEATGAEPSDTELVNESVRPNGSGESASAPA